MVLLEGGSEEKPFNEHVTSRLVQQLRYSIIKSIKFLRGKAKDLTQSSSRKSMMEFQFLVELDIKELIYLSIPEGEKEEQVHHSNQVKEALEIIAGQKMDEVIEKNQITNELLVELDKAFTLLSDKVSALNRQKKVQKENELLKVGYEQFEELKKAEIKKAEEN